MRREERERNIAVPGEEAPGGPERPEHEPATVERDEIDDDEEDWDEEEDDEVEVIEDDEDDEEDGDLGVAWARRGNARHAAPR
jgi:hypothetical protein